MRQDFGSVFARWLSKFKNRRSENDDFWAPSIGTAMNAAIVLDETDDALVIRASVSGLSKKDVGIELTEERLVIRGGRASSRTGRPGYEESLSSFVQAISLPCEVNSDKARARLKNGLLTVTLPKTERAKSRTIQRFGSGNPKGSWLRLLVLTLMAWGRLKGA